MNDLILHKTDLLRCFGTVMFCYFTYCCPAQLQSKYKTWRQNQYVVTASKLNVREEGHEKARIIDQVSLGKKVFSLEPTVLMNKEQLDRPYYHVEYSDQGSRKRGFVAARYLSQKYIEDRDELLYLKLESDTEISLNILKNGEHTFVDKVASYDFRDILFSAVWTNDIEGVERLVQLEIEDDDCCSSSYSFITFVETTSGHWLDLPAYNYSSEGGGEDIMYLQLPNDPYGQKNRLNLIQIRHKRDDVTFEPKINEIEIVKSYTVEDGVVKQYEQ